MCFFRKRRERKRALEAEKLQQAQKESQPVVKEATVEPEVQKVAVVQEIPETKVDNVEVEPAKVAPESPKTEKVAKYHVSQNKDEDSENFKKWRVRKEGSTKTIKFFDTQKEAILFAEDLAEKAGSSVVIHKVDGSIRKQDYAKKA
jgi:uncharacterized protein YdaT